MKNNLSPNVFRVKFTGDYGLFNNVSTNVERFSYPVPTFSAAKGMFESIYWKPEFDWKILNIQVLNEIKYQNFFRNEVVNQKYGVNRNPVSILSNRTQRNSMVLVNPSYIITAQLIQKEHDNAYIKKHIEIFQRRVIRGANYRQTYFGIKEYGCYFCFPDGTETIHESLKGEMDLSLILNAIQFQNDTATPVFKKMKMIDGLVMEEGN